MENNCFILKLKDSLLGNYDKLNFLKVKVTNGERVVFSPDKRANITIKAEGCTFTLPYFLITSTEHTFQNISPYLVLDFNISGDGYLYISNKYDLGAYLIYNVDLDKIYSLDKAIKKFIVPYGSHSYVKGNINHLLSQCSPDLSYLLLSSSGERADITGDITLINNFINLNTLTLTNKAFSGNIIAFSALVNLTLLSLFDSNCTGSVEELALAWHINGKTSGTTKFLFNNTSIIVPSVITNKDNFYCTFTEGGYSFSLTKPNT